MFHRTLRMLLVVVFATTTLVASNGAAGATATTGTSTEAKDLFGCPAGYVCIYPKGQPYTEGNPDAMFSSYGHHNLSGRYGTHDIMNNQWVEEGDDAYVYLNSGYNGGGKVLDKIGHGGAVTRTNLTPVNSITLNP